MQNITTARWKGRITAAFRKILAINNLKFPMQDIPDDKWPAVFSALLPHITSPKEKELCRQLMAKSAILFCETEDSSHKVSANDPQEIAVGMREVEFWYEKDSRVWGGKILDDVDYVPMIEEDERKKTKLKKIVVISFLSFVAVIIASCIIYNLPYFVEKRAFAVVEENPCLYEIDKYIRDFPQGAHMEQALSYRAEELRRIEDENYQTVKESWDGHDAKETLYQISSYLNGYPNGRYVDSVKVLYNTIWDSIINKYDRSVDYKLSAPGHAYMHDMLEYMRENDVRTVRVVGHPEFSLKEFDEYPKNIQSLMTLYDVDPNGRFKLPRDLRPIKDNITTSAAEKWTVNIIKTLNQKFDSLFGSEFIKCVSSGTVGTTANCPIIDVKYVIKNQEIFGSIPDVWTYTQTTQDGVVLDGGLYLGIALDFTAVFSLPNDNASYKVSVSGDPGHANFKDVDPSEIYNKMCDRCLVMFGTEIENSLGLTATAK